VKKNWQKYTIDMSTVLSRVRDKQYRSVVIGIVTNSILLLVFVGQLVAAYINHRPAYEELEYIAWVVMNTVLLADNIHKLVSQSKNNRAIL
jgi:hypothetical protein